MRLIFMYSIVILTMYSCVNKEYTDYTYYKSGGVKEKRIFKSREDLLKEKTYKVFKYSESGTLLTQFEFILGFKNGSYLEYYPTGKLRSSILYNNDKKEGLERHFSENGELVEEIFYINDTPLIKMKSYNSRNETIDFYYYIEKDSLIENGLLVKDEAGKVDADKSFYYQVSSEDTIVVNEPNSIKIETYTMGKKNVIRRAIFGSFDENFDFKNPNEVITQKSNDNQISYSFTPRKQGDLLIMGKIYIQGDTLDSEIGSSERELIVYRQVYVK